MASADNKVEAHVGDRVCRVSGSCKIWIILFGAIASLFALVFVIMALKSLFLPCGHGQLAFSNECEIAVEKVVVSFGKNTVELSGIPPHGKSTEHFFVRDDCTCRVVATLADGLVISNSYGYYCYGMDCGTVTVTLTNDKRVKIVDKYFREDIAETVSRLKAIVMPESSFYAPATIKDFVEYMNQATKDFDDPGVPLEKRGIKFVCTESVAAKTGPENQKSDVPLIPCPGVGTATTAWDVLTNVCESVGCKFVVRQGKVELVTDKEYFITLKDNRSDDKQQ